MAFRDRIKGKYAIEKKLGQGQGSYFFQLKKNIYTRACLVGRLSNRTISAKVGLTGQFCFLGVGLTGQLENKGRLTVLVIENKSV